LLVSPPNVDVVSRPGHLVVMVPLHTRVYTLLALTTPVLHQDLLSHSRGGGGQAQAVCRKAISGVSLTQKGIMNSGLPTLCGTRYPLWTTQSAGG
jgi:hypothetical protein